MIRRVVATAIVATVLGGLSTPVFAEPSESQFCLVLNKKSGGNDNICIDLEDPARR